MRDIVGATKFILALGRDDHATDTQSSPSITPLNDDQGCDPSGSTLPLPHSPHDPLPHVSPKKANQPPPPPPHSSTLESIDHPSSSACH